MSKYNLTNLLKEYVGGSKIGDYLVSARQLVNKMEKLENKRPDLSIKRTDGSGDGKVSITFTVAKKEQDSNKQEKGFTVYDYKVGDWVDERDEYEGAMDEKYAEKEIGFSIGGNDIELAKEVLPGVEEWTIDENNMGMYIDDDEWEEEMGRGKKKNVEPDHDWESEVKQAREGKKIKETFDRGAWDKLERLRDAIDDDDYIIQSMMKAMSTDDANLYLDAMTRDHIDIVDDGEGSVYGDKSINAAKTLEKFTEAKDWIQKAIKRPGALHRALDIPRDKDIPHSLINKDIKKMDDLEDEEGNLDKRDLRFLRQLDLAKTLEKFNENKEPGKLTGIEDVINTLGEDDLEKIVAYMKERGRLTETVDEDIWVMAEKAITHLGTDQFAEALVRAMSTDDAKLYITGILRDWDIPMADEDYAKYLNESLEESVVKNMVTLLSDYGSESEINTYMDSVGREFMMNPKSVEDYNDFNDDDWVEDFREWINDKYEDVREHFNRFK